MPDERWDHAEQVAEARARFNISLSPQETHREQTSPTNLTVKNIIPLFQGGTCNLLASVTGKFQSAKRGIYLSHYVAGTVTFYLYFPHNDLPELRISSFTINMSHKHFIEKHF